VYYEVTVEGTDYPPIVGESTITTTPVPVHIKSNDDLKVYDGQPLTNWTGKATITTNGVTTTWDVQLGVNLIGDDYINITYTGSQTDVGFSDNSFIYTFVNPSKAIDYTVTTEFGKLEVIPAPIEAESQDVVKYYDAQPTNIVVKVNPLPDGTTPLITYSYTEEGDYKPLDKFDSVVDVTEGSTRVYYIVEGGKNYTPVKGSSTVTVLPRIVVEHAESASKKYDRKPLVQPAHYWDEWASRNWARDIYELGKYPELYAGPRRDDWENAVGFMGGDGFAIVPMTADSTITKVGSKPNLIDAARVALLPGTLTKNYYLDYLPGELQVVNSQSPSCHDIDPELSTCRIGFKLKISGELADEDFKKGYKTVKRVSGSGSLFIDGEGHVKEKFDK
ncbi:MAG: hypothetical protein MJ139_06655, partial [Limosilactobacillus sp.]|nr:hypothetical protein [Limosilactobacillus sp.]